MFNYEFYYVKSDGLTYKTCIPGDNMADAISKFVAEFPDVVPKVIRRYK